MFGLEMNGGSSGGTFVKGDLTTEQIMGYGSQWPQEDIKVYRREEIRTITHKMWFD